MENSILQTLQYFRFFDYAPTVNELYRFLGRKTSKKALQNSLKRINNIVIEKGSIYTGGEYRIQLKSGSLNVKRYEKRKQIAGLKIKKIEPFLRLILRFPQVKLIGLSGSVAMMDAKEGDDIDLFVITDKNNLWTGRFVCLLVAGLLGRRRRFNQSHTNDKICLNLFFDGRSLSVPLIKHTEYVAHEILQMKPLVDKDNIYRRFLKANNWVFTYFPNAVEVADSSFSRAQTGSSFSPPIWLAQLVELLLKTIQLYFINKHKTKEIITDTQLWFFPDDFEKRLKDLPK